MPRGASLWGFWLAFGLALGCEDANEQRFPFTYDALDDGAPTAPAAEAPAEEDVVLVDAGEAPLDAAVIEAGLEEAADDAADDSAEDGVDDAVDDAGAELDAGGEAEADESALDDEADGGASDEGLTEAPDEGAAGTRDDELFGGGAESAESAETLTASDGGPPAQGAPPGQGAPLGQRAPPGIAQRGPVTFPPVPPGGAGTTMPLYPGETFDVATLAGGYTALVMKNVALRLDEDVNVFVVSLSGALVPAAMDVVDLDRPGDLQVVLDEAEVRISEEDLGRIFERYLFEEEDDFGDDLGGGAESPLRDVEVTLERGRVVLKAELEEGGDDVELRGTLEPTVSGDVAFIPTSLRRDDKPVDALEDVFEEGVGMNSFGDDELRGGLGSIGAGPVLWIDADAMYFDPEAIVRAPALDGDVIDVKVTGSHVRLLLEGNAPEVKTLGPPGGVENYVEMRGGAVRFGKVIMPRADLLFLDADESDPLDLSLHRFDEQVIAGDTRMRPDLGLESTLPDFDEIPESAFEVPDDDDGGALDDAEGGSDDDGGELGLDGDAGDEGSDESSDEGSDEGSDANGASRDEELFE